MRVIQLVDLMANSSGASASLRFGATVSLSFESTCASGRGLGDCEYARDVILVQPSMTAMLCTSMTAMLCRSCLYKHDCDQN